MARDKTKAQVRNEGDTVVGLFQDQPAAEAAIQRLTAAGFREQQIGVAVRDREQQKAITEGTGAQTAEAATTGALGGGVVGGVIGLLAGVGALAIPGVGPIIAGGALASTLAGAGVGAAAGGLLGALVGMGIPEEDAKHFEEGFKQGGILVTVQAGARVSEARHALAEGGTADLGPTTRNYARTAATDRTEETQRLELREEELDVNTRQVQAGEVRLGKEVVTEQRSIEVPVSREEVVIERHPVAGREASDATLDAEEEVRIPLMEEEVEVRKRPVVREEISLGKRRVQGTETVTDTVRREEARIDTEGEVGMGTDGGRERRQGRQLAYQGPERRLASAR
ncbi:MAG TPA: YsnF/AvaK domain-containing protein [Gemmatimonadales bacterium]|nr:YsnF/AvaK domain-containing protein [Gemmatimonadales bacterium]